MSNLELSVQVIAFNPANHSELWVGCDGGVFFANQAQRTTNLATLFSSANHGLATLQTQYMDRHPVSDSVLRAGTQDNGGLRYIGSPLWDLATFGDAGYAAIDPNNPHRYRMGVFNNRIDGSNTGGEWTGFSFNTNVATPGGAPLFYPPIRRSEDTFTPVRLIFGAFRPFVSNNFGTTFTAAGPGGPLADEIRSIGWYQNTRFFVGTVQGDVAQYNLVGATWSAPIPLHTQPTQSPGPTYRQVSRNQPVMDFAVDPADPAGNSFYLQQFPETHKSQYSPGIPTCLFVNGHAKMGLS